MLLLSEPNRHHHHNITFFADDSDDNQFWYLPGDIHIAQKAGRTGVFAAQIHRRRQRSARGYINFEVNTAIDEAVLNRAFNDYLRKLNVDPKNARKAQVPYDKGTVNFFVLDAGATNGELISPCPSLFGNNSAIFSAS